MCLRLQAKLTKPMIALLIHSRYAGETVPTRTLSLCDWIDEVAEANQRRRLLRSFDLACVGSVVGSLRTYISFDLFVNRDYMLQEATNPTRHSTTTVAVGVSRSEINGCHNGRCGVSHFIIRRSRPSHLAVSKDFCKYHRFHESNLLRLVVASSASCLDLKTQLEAQRKLTSSKHYSQQ